LREERRLRVFENRVLRRVDEMTGEWRKLHNEELNDLYPLPSIVRVVKSRRMRWSGHVVRMGEERGVHRVLVGKPEGKRPLGRPRRRWEDNIKMNVEDVGGGRGDWIELAQDRDRWRALVSTVKNLSRLNFSLVDSLSPRIPYFNLDCFNLPPLEICRPGPGPL
jgi:hypothetical protein